jgi:adenylate cyclase
VLEPPKSVSPAKGKKFLAGLTDGLGLFIPGALLTLAVALMVLRPPEWFTFLDYKVYDVMLRARPKPAKSDLPVIVDIDEKSLAKYGQWPWPRYLVGYLLARLKEYGVRAAGLDMVFSEPDRTSLGRIQGQLKDYLHLDMQYQGLPEKLRDNDRLLAEVLGGGPYVLGYFFTFSGQDYPLAGKQGQILLPPPRISLSSSPGSAGVLSSLPGAVGAVCPLPEFVEAGKWAGFFNSFPDRDNIVRWVPLVLPWQGSVYPSLAVATLMRAYGDKGAVLRLEKDPAGLAQLTLMLDLGELGRREIPLAWHGRVLLDYRGPARTYPYLSASDVMDGEVPPQSLAGKIAFVGTSVRGLGDIRATPLDPSFVGVEAHADIADMILSDRYIRDDAQTRGLAILLCLCLGLGVTALIVRTRSLWAGLIGLVAGAAVWFGGQEALSGLDAYVSPLGPLMALSADFSLLSFLKFLREERQKRFIQEAFGHYLSPDVVDEILAQPDKLTLSGEEREVSILFSDVRGFTGISEKLAPGQVVDLLHEYFTPMTRLIISNRGTLDKFIGDAVMAFWNAPRDVAGHPALAVHTALAMLGELEGLNKGFAAKYGFKLHIGVGLNLGAVRVGNFGSEDLFDYTIIGDQVNLCSRLEGLTKYYHQPLLLTQSMKQGAGEAFAYQEIDRVLVKGKHEPVTIHTATTHEEAQVRAGELERWSQGLGLYRLGRFSQAAEIFRELENLGNGLYGLYRERCQALAANPPGPDWDGVFTHTTK